MSCNFHRTLKGSRTFDFYGVGAVDAIWRLTKKGVSLLMRSSLLLLLIPLLTGCDGKGEIVSEIEEREANVILVLLESKGIPATKSLSSSNSMATGGGGGVPKYAISVPQKWMIEAIALLNQNGFPKSKGISLLDLFAKQGLMTSDKEETIRYQAGLAQQLANTVLMIDGVIDASVQLSFPPTESALPGETVTQKITAAVYVKHQGIIDDPNVHLTNKIKRLVSGSVSGLDIDDVTVVSDRSRFTDIALNAKGEITGNKPTEYVNIWSIVMSKESVFRFRFLFFLISTIAIVFAMIFGWLIWKFYPILKKRGAIKDLFNPVPWLAMKKNEGEVHRKSDSPPSDEEEK